LIKGGWLHEGSRAFGKSGSFSFFQIDQIDGMALVAGLGSRMSLMAMITGLHLRAIGSKGSGIVGDVAMTIDA